MVTVSLVKELKTKKESAQKGPVISALVQTVKIWTTTVTAEPSDRRRPSKFRRQDVNLDARRQSGPQPRRGTDQQRRLHPAGRVLGDL